MKVALIPSSFHPAVGGVEEFTAKLAEQLVHNGDQVEVWTSRSPGDELQGREIVDGIVVRRFDFAMPRASVAALGRTAVSATATTRALRRAARDFTPDVLSVQCFSANGVYATGLSRITGIPLVVSLHGETLMDDRDIYNHSQALRAGLRLGLKQASWVTSCSQFALDDAVRRFGCPPSRSSVIFNGVDLEEGRACEEVPLPFDVFALALGRIVPKKGFDLLVEAVDIMALPAGHGIVIGGQGPSLHELEELVARRGLQDKVHFTGRLTRPQVAYVMQQARCLVMPSRLEPFGIVVLEAWRAGRPVVATRWGGPPEFIKDGRDGRLVSPENTEELAATVKELLFDKAVADALGSAGAVRIQEFSWDRVATQHRDKLVGALPSGAISSGTT